MEMNTKKNLNNFKTVQKYLKKYLVFQSKYVENVGKCLSFRMPFELEFIIAFLGLLVSGVLHDVLQIRS